MATTAPAIQLHTPRRPERAVVVCHCTTVHAQLKSRTYHRQMLPLAEAGVRVHFVAPMHQREFPEGMALFTISRPTNPRRKFLAWLHLTRTLLLQNADLYHIQDPQLLPLGFVLKLLFRKSVVYDAYEDFPSMAAVKKSVPRPLRALFAFTLALVERLAARCFDAIITADPLTLRRLARHGKSRKLVFYNFPNLSFFPPQALPNENRAFDLVYRGGLSERTGTFVLLEALAQLAARPNPPRLLLLGYFDDRDSEGAVCRRIRELGLDSLVEIRERIDHERMSQALSQARMGICPLLAIRKFQINIPVKIFEYWSCGLPVIASDLAPTRPFFRNGEAGLLVEPGSTAELATSIAWLLDHPVDASRMGRRGRQLVVRRYNNAHEVKKLGRLFASLVRAPKEAASSDA